LPEKKESDIKLKLELTKMKICPKAVNTLEEWQVKSHRARTTEGGERHYYGKLPNDSSIFLKPRKKHEVKKKLKHPHSPLRIVNPSIIPLNSRFKKIDSSDSLLENSIPIKYDFDYFKQKQLSKIYG
jgi:hypothetical protein